MEKNRNRTDQSTYDRLITQVNTVLKDEAIDDSVLAREIVHELVATGEAIEAFNRGDREYFTQALVRDKVMEALEAEKEVQDAKKLFIEKYAKSSPDWKHEWSSFLNNIDNDY